MMRLEGYVHVHVVVVVNCPGGGSSPRHVFPLVGEAQAGEGEKEGEGKDG